MLYVADDLSCLSLSDVEALCRTPLRNLAALRINVGGLDMYGANANPQRLSDDVHKYLEIRLWLSRQSDEEPDLAMECPRPESYVRLAGLQARSELNGSLGQVIGPPGLKVPLRVPVRVHGERMLLKPQNLTPLAPTLPPTLAHLAVVGGSEDTELFAEAFDEDERSLRYELRCGHSVALDGPTPPVPLPELQSLAGISYGDLEATGMLEYGPGTWFGEPRSGYMATRLQALDVAGYIDGDQLHELLRVLRGLRRLSFQNSSSSSDLIETIEAAHSVWPETLSTVYLTTDSEEGHTKDMWRRAFSPLGAILEEAVVRLDSCELLAECGYDDIADALRRALPKASVLVASVYDIFFQGDGGGTTDGALTRVFWPTLLEAWQAHSKYTGCCMHRLRPGQRAQDTRLASLIPTVAHKL